MPQGARVLIDLQGSSDLRRFLEEAAVVIEQLLERRTSFEEEVLLVEPLEAWEVPSATLEEGIDVWEADGDLHPANRTTHEAIAALVRLGSNPALPAGTLIRITAEPPGHDDAGA